MLFLTSWTMEYFGLLFRTADKLVKAHCLPLDRTLKRSSPWCRLAERNKGILTWIFLNQWLMHVHWCARNTKNLTWPPPSFRKFPEAWLFTPELRDLNRHKSRFRLYITRPKRLDTSKHITVLHVKNSVLPSAAIKFLKRSLIVNFIWSTSFRLPVCSLRQVKW